MALRRLLSGWLIAMAALARSVAQALERASEDRSASTPDPVMAALAERYPGAPAHWLAHVAERTSQLAEAGEAPLSLNSDPAAWPPERPLSARLDDLPARPVTPAEAVVSRDPRRPRSPDRDSAVPTLAALRDRSSEVWRRPDVERPRRPRPVFAAATSAPVSERPARSTTEPGVTPRRPRSPVSFAGPPAQAVPSKPHSTTPTSDTPAAKTASREAAWSEPPTARAAKAWPDVRRTAEGPPIDHAFTQARPKDAPEAPSDRIDAKPAVRRQRSWFFARPASVRGGQPLGLSAYPERRPGGDRADAVGPIVIGRTPAPRATAPVSTSDRQTVAPERIWPALTPPAARRSIFRALVALMGKPRARVELPLASESSVARAAATLDRPSPRSGQERPPLSVTPPRAGPSARAALSVSPIAPAASPIPTEERAPRRAAHRVVRRASSLPTSAGETLLQDKRATFAPPRSASRAAPRGFAVSPPDDRWPTLPPTTFAPPPGVAAPSPRWDVLAREQEEGRWSV